ncbi:hypothetical protein LCGC14_2687590 [marine sediment metagenome]|uniref:Uncharacterized protein n=1 Tax=marine sediment metagenome TaxID=412755 RepID=A0A0F9BU70_9ZZZZ
MKHEDKVFAKQCENLKLEMENNFKLEWITRGLIFLGILIFFLLIPFVLKPVAEGWGPFPVLILSFWIFVLQSLVLTIFGIFNISSNKVSNKNLLKYLRLFGYISFITGIALFMLIYISLVLIISGIFMIYIGIKKAEDFLD